MKVPKQASNQQTTTTIIIATSTREKKVLKTGVSFHKMTMHSAYTIHSILFVCFFSIIYSNGYNQFFF